jgi:Zn-finger protein
MRKIPNKKNLKKKKERKKERKRKRKKEKRNKKKKTKKQRKKETRYPLHFSKRSWSQCYLFVSKGKRKERNRLIKGGRGRGILP